VRGEGLFLGLSDILQKKSIKQQIFYALRFFIESSIQPKTTPHPSSPHIYIFIRHPNLKVFFNSLTLNNLVSPFVVCLPLETPFIFILINFTPNLTALISYFIPFE
jgi:hypothetical protein